MFGSFRLFFVAENVGKAVNFYLFYHSSFGKSIYGSFFEKTGRWNTALRLTF
jgi:hypothetical protein